MSDAQSDESVENPCPECGAELGDLIDYIRGCKTSAGRHCPECGYEVIW